MVRIIFEAGIGSSNNGSNNVGSRYCSNNVGSRY